MHALTITHEIWEEDGVECEEWDYEIEHEPDCPTETRYSDPLTGNYVTEFTCDIGDHVMWVGLDGMWWPEEIAAYDPKLQAWEQWHAIPPGRYEIEFWQNGWGDEWESGINIVRRLTEES